MKRWVLSKSPNVMMLLGVACVIGGAFLSLRGVGLIMGDPMTAEAHAFQARWAPIMFFLGCPTGIGLVVFGVWVLVVASPRAEKD